MRREREKGKKGLVTNSSGNIFSDLNLPSSEEDMLKVKIAREIAVTIEQRGLTQLHAAQITGVDQSKISAIVRGRLKDFKVDRLFNYLTALGNDVDIHISRRPRNEHGRIRVTA